MRLTLELHVGRVEDLHDVNFDVLALKNVVALVDMRVEHGNEDGLVYQGKRFVDRTHEVMPQIGNKTAQGVRQAGTCRNEDLGHPKLARQRGRMKRASTTARQRDELPRVMAACQ